MSTEISLAVLKNFTVNMAPTRNIKLESSQLQESYGCIIYVLVSPIISSFFVILECTDILNCPSIYTYRVVCFGVKPNFTRFLHTRTCFTKVELNPICPQILTPHKLHGFQCIVHGTGEKNRVHSMRRAF